MNSTEGRQGMNRVNRDRVRIRRTIFFIANLDNYAPGRMFHGQFFSVV